MVWWGETMTADPGHRRHRLVLVRHAKSSWDDPTLGDHDRPLAPRGHKAIRRMRAHLEQLRPRPEVVWCSSARRARETLDGIRPALGRRARVEIEAGLYGADAQELMTRLATIDDNVRCLLVIAHNPGIADLTAVLVARGDRATAPADAFPTGAIVVVSFAGPWRDLQPATASLDSSWQPRPRR